MKIVVQAVRREPDTQDYSEFEAMKASLAVAVEEPDANGTEADDAYADLLRFVIARTQRAG